MKNAIKTLYNCSFLKLKFENHVRGYIITMNKQVIKHGMVLLLLPWPQKLDWAADGVPLLLYCIAQWLISCWKEFQTKIVISCNFTVTQKKYKNKKISEVMWFLEQRNCPFLYQMKSTKCWEGFMNHHVFIHGVSIII